MKTINNEILDLYDLFIEQLRDLFDGEHQELKALKKFDALAASFELVEIIEYHRKETLRQIQRLTEIFELLNEPSQSEKCNVVKELITKALKLAKRCQNDEVRDAGLITSLQHINHYEIAGYGTAIAYAKELDQHEVGQLLLETLREEKASDMGLSEIAENTVNPHARWSDIIAKAGREREKVQK